MRLLRHQLHVTYTDVHGPLHENPRVQNMHCHIIICKGVSAVITAAPAREWNTTRTRFASDTSQGCNDQAHFWESATQRQQNKMRCSENIHPVEEVLVISGGTGCFPLETNVIITLVFGAPSNQIKVGNTVFLCVRLLFSTCTLLMRLM